MVVPPDGEGLTEGETAPAEKAAALPAPDGRIASFLPPSPKQSAPAASKAAPLSRRAIAAAVAAGLLLGLVLIIGISRIGASPQDGAVSLSITPIGAPTAAPSPVATPFGYPLGAATVAYFDPRDLSSATALESGTRFVPVARIARDWLQLRLANGAAVWVRWPEGASGIGCQVSGEAPGSRNPVPDTRYPCGLDSLPDLAPPTDAPAQPTPAPLFQPPALSPQPSAPHECQTVAERDAAPYKVVVQVKDDAGRIIGTAMGASCLSQEVAERHAEEHAAEVRRGLVTPTAAPADAPIHGVFDWRYQMTDQAIVDSMHQTPISKPTQ